MRYHLNFHPNYIKSKRKFLEGLSCDNARHGYAIGGGCYHIEGCNVLLQFKDIKDLGLSKRAIESLGKLDIKCIAELVTRNNNELLMACKKKTIKEIKSVLKSYGLRLNMKRHW